MVEGSSPSAPTSFFFLAQSGVDIFTELETHLKLAAPLKMPVGEKNQMVVRLEGGYKQITLRTLAKAPLRGS